MEAGSVKTFKESKRLYVSKFSIIYTNQTKSIGDPFNYSDYKQNVCKTFLKKLIFLKSFVNHKGSNKIPLANIGSGHGMSENLHQNPQSARVIFYKNHLQLYMINLKISCPIQF